VGGTHRRPAAPHAAGATRLASPGRLPGRTGRSLSLGGALVAGLVLAVALI